MDGSIVLCMDSTAGQTRSPSARSHRNKELGLRPRRSRHRLTLNTDAFLAFMGERRKTSFEEIAAYLDLGYGTVHAALGGRPISDGFVSALLKVLPASRPLQEFLIHDDARVAA